MSPKHIYTDQTISLEMKQLNNWEEKSCFSQKTTHTHICGRMSFPFFCTFFILEKQTSHETRVGDSLNTVMHFSSHLFPTCWWDETKPALPRYGVTVVFENSLPHNSSVMKCLKCLEGSGVQENETFKPSACFYGPKKSHTTFYWSSVKLPPPLQKKNVFWSVLI